MTVNDEFFSKITSSNERHFENDALPIELTLDGIIIFFNAEHPLNAPSPIIVTDGDKMTSFNDAHPSKA